MTGKSVFVTVGTTRFDSLIQAVVEENTLRELRNKDYTRLLLQIGKGHFIPPEGEYCGVQLSYFRLKPSIAEYFSNADLVVSHAGAGSCLEALEAGKPLIAVVNDSLMDNHQTELAEELANCGFSYCCYPNTLHYTIKNMELSKLSPYIPGQPKLLAKYLDSVIKVVNT